MSRFRLGLVRRICLFFLIAVSGTPAMAREEVKIGIGYGIAFLPIFICSELRLVEKRAKVEGLDLDATYHRISGSSEMQDAVLSGSVDIGVLGPQAVLIAWEQAKGTPQQIFGLAGVTTLPLALLSNRPSIRSVKDFKPDDRIAMPALVSPQMYALQMAAEKAFGPGQHDRLRPLVVAMPHPQAYKALMSREAVTAYFAPPPFTQMAMRSGHISTVLTSEDAFGGKMSFLVAAATKGYLDENPKIAAVITGALDEAIRIIKEDPGQAAQIFLKQEPSQTLNLAEVEGLLAELRNDFGIDVHGIKTSAEFMARIEQLKHAPSSWSEVFVGPIRETNSD